MEIPLPQKQLQGILLQDTNSCPLGEDAGLHRDADADEDAECEDCWSYISTPSHQILYFHATFKFYGNNNSTNDVQCTTHNWNLE